MTTEQAPIVEPVNQQPEGETMPIARRILLGIGLPIWTAVGFFSASLVVGLVIAMLLQINLLTLAVNGPVFMSVVAALVYIMALLIVIGVPFKFYGFRTTKADLGLNRLPSWLDILLAPASFVVYLFLAGIVLSAVTSLFPGFNANEAQEIGFENLSKYYEYILAFITLVIMAPVAEEVLVRGYLYGKLRKFMPAFGAVAVTALLFAALHLDYNGSAVTQWNVTLNVLPLGIILALLRESTGNIWAGILLHMIKNGIAFYFLFINPMLLHTIGG